MYKERDGNRISVIWRCSHILATILAIVKLCRGISDWPWWIVLAPFIFDLVLFIAIIFGISFIVFFSTL
jgi:hypothetical protein